METNVLINKGGGHEIPCVVRVPEYSKQVVIIIHGFCSGKQGQNASFLLEKLPAKNIGAVAYDQPGHGEAADEQLGMTECLRSLAIVERYVSEIWPDKEICYFASSFGAYVLGIYLATCAHSGRKAVMRSAAVDFPEIMTEGASEEQKRELEEKGSVDICMEPGNTVKVTKSFLRELPDLTEIFRAMKPGDTEMLFVHGSEDQTVDLKKVRAFTDEFGYPLRVFRGEDHSISLREGSPKEIAELAAGLFTGREWNRE